MIASGRPVSRTRCHIGTCLFLLVSIIPTFSLPYLLPSRLLPSRLAAPPDKNAPIDTNGHETTHNEKKNKKKNGTTPNDDNHFKLIVFTLCDSPSFPPLKRGEGGGRMREAILQRYLRFPTLHFHRRCGSMWCRLIDLKGIEADLCVFFSIKGRWVNTGVFVWIR